MWLCREIRSCHSGSSRILTWSYLQYCQHCICQLREILYIWPGSGAVEDLLLRVENLPRWAAEFGKLARGMWKNLPRKTVVPMYNHWYSLHSCLLALSVWLSVCVSRSGCLSLCLSALMSSGLCMSVCLSLSLSVCLSVCLIVSLSICPIVPLSWSVCRYQWYPAPLKSF